MSKEKSGRKQVASAIDTQTKVLGLLIVFGFVANMFRRPKAPFRSYHPGEFTLGADQKTIVFEPDGSDERYTGDKLAAMHAKVNLVFQLTSRSSGPKADMDPTHGKFVLALADLIENHALLSASVKGGSSCCKANVQHPVDGEPV